MIATTKKYLCFYQISEYTVYKSPAKEGTELLNKHRRWNSSQPWIPPNAMKMEVWDDQGRIKKTCHSNSIAYLDAQMQH